MSDNGVIEYMPSLEVPVAGFACRSNRVFIEASTVLSAVARITFSDVRTYLPGRSVQLVCNSNGTAIFCKASYVVPAKIGEKQAKTISFHFPERIFTDRSRNACFPFCVGHSHLALSLHLAPLTAYNSSSRFTHHSSVRLHEWEKNHISDALGSTEHHHQPVDSHSHSARRRHSIS